jgi:hypothetical protein
MSRRIKALIYASLLTIAVVLLIEVMLEIKLAWYYYILIWFIMRYLIVGYFMKLKSGFIAYSINPIESNKESEGQFITTGRCEITHKAGETRFLEFIISSTKSIDKANLGIILEDTSDALKSNLFFQGEASTSFNFNGAVVLVKVKFV